MGRLFLEMGVFIRVSGDWECFMDLEDLSKTREAITKGSSTMDMCMVGETK